jgi:DNA polymerase-3 subunit gamma/tau
MFASTHPQEFPPAILSRLQRYDVRRLTVAEIEGKLTRILEADGRSADPDAVRLIARLAAGGMRDAESMLDQLLASATDRLDESRVRDLLGLADAEAVRGFVAALVDGDPIAGIRILDGLEDRGRDPRVFLDQVVDAVRADLVSTLSSGASSHAARLAAAARRLAAIDPNRAGTGGLRLQLELALFADAQPSHAAQPVAAEPVAAEPVPALRTAEPAARMEPSTLPRQPAGELPARRAKTKPAAAGPTTRPDPVMDMKPAEPPRAGAPSAASGDLAALLGRWQELVASVSPATRAVIRECRPLSVDGAVVTLAFPEAKAFLKDQAERRRPDLESAVGGFLGRSVSVRCVASNIDLVSEPTERDAAFVLDEARKIFAEELVDVGEVS